MRTILLDWGYAEALRLVEEIIAEEPSTATSMVGVRVDSMAHLGRQAEAKTLFEGRREDTWIGVGVV